MSKLDKAVPREFRHRLLDDDLDLLQSLEIQYRFSLQNLKITSEAMVDARTWEDDRFQIHLRQLLAKVDAEEVPLKGKQLSAWIFSESQKYFQTIQREEKAFTGEGEDFDARYKYVHEDFQGEIYRRCPAYAECGVCCDLQVLKIVENCAMGCSYCVLQSYDYESIVRVIDNLPQKLKEIEIPRDRFIRIGTGEYSDSLFWGNRNGILDDLFKWIPHHPNAILELKTKSANIGYLLENDIPGNVCTSWSLNPQALVEFEEKGTASLDERLEAARRVADKGAKVGFHIHPMMYYKGWQEDYYQLGEKLVKMFDSQEVLWATMGCVTMLKSFPKQFRSSYVKSKLLQMPKELTPDGKLTYAEDIREKLYSNILNALNPWKDSVVQYLCMEFDPMWKKLFGKTYQNPDGLNDLINSSAFPKLNFD